MEGTASSLEEEVARLRQELAHERKLRQQLEQQLSTFKQEPLRPHQPEERKGSKRGGLADVRVLDLSRVLAGPYCSMLLADMGADVLKLEVPRLGDDSRQYPPFVKDVSLYYVNLNRGKRSMTLNLKHEEGKRIFLELVRQSDVLLENFSPGTMERLGLGYEALKAVKPDLVYASISGFGQTGPYRSRPGYDIISQAMSGLMSVTGWPETPPTRAGTAVGDVMGALFTCIGILSALHVRNRTGEGQLVDVALIDSLFASLGQHLQKYFVEGDLPTRIGNRYEFIYPYDSFRAADGWVIIAIANDSLWTRFVEATDPKSCALDGMSPKLNAEEFTSNPKRLLQASTLKELIEEWTSRHSVQSIVSLLVQQRIPACPIASLNDVVNDEHIAKAREMVVKLEQPELGTVQLMGNPMKMSLTSPKPQGPAPSLGQHTHEILQELLGLSESDLQRLKENQII